MLGLPLRHRSETVRTNRARRAAFVIQADTLTPSSAAAASTWAWTSGSTDCRPIGLPEASVAIQLSGQFGSRDTDETG